MRAMPPLMRYNFWSYDIDENAVKRCNKCSLLNAMRIGKKNVHRQFQKTLQIDDFITSIVPTLNFYV